MKTARERADTIYLCGSIQVIEHEIQSAMDDTLEAAAKALREYMDHSMQANKQILKERARIAKLEEALRTLPLWTPQPRSEVFGPEGDRHDPLYGKGPKYYPAGVVVSADVLVAVREVLEQALAQPAVPKTIQGPTAANVCPRCGKAWGSHSVHLGAPGGYDCPVEQAVAQPELPQPVVPETKSVIQVDCDECEGLGRAAPRCLVTGNPVGTDTRPVGSPCQCAACKSAEAWAGEGKNCG